MNIEIPIKLKKAIQEKKLVIFVGAGLSLNHGLPNWSQVTESILKRYKNEILKSEHLLSALQNGILDPLETLDKIKEHKELVFDTFEQELSITVTSSGIHKSLSTITNKFVTTNFDTLLEDNISSCPVLLPDSKYQLAKIDKQDSYILKFHGDIKSIDKCIIFDYQYQELYGDSELATFQLKKVLSENTALFIGFSFSDPYVKELFEQINSLYDEFSREHYILTTDITSPSPNLKPLTINNYQDLPQFIDLLSHLKRAELGEEKNKKISADDKNEINYREIDGGDIPPKVQNWVGRLKELNMLKAYPYKVIAITGIGGEGKSALAAKLLDEASPSGEYEIIEWRDFKEEEHNFQHKLFTMIKAIEHNFNFDSITGLNDDQIINVFFQELGKKKAIFVLDNIDSYIDLESFTPGKGMKKFLEKAIEYDHASTFVFTCRPLIQFAATDFMQIGLSGLEKKETIDYFLKGNLPLSKDKIISYAIKSQKLTNGHALWLSLTLAQARRSEAHLNSFLKQIETGSDITISDSSVLSGRILNNIWKSLTERDRLVLRTLAESVRPETADDYAEILKPELNHNKFSKAIRTLKSFNLIIEKSQTSFIELHPLVKEFIKNNYQTNERKKFISLFIKHYDKFVIVLKKTMSHELSFEEFSNFTNKAELSITAGDFQSAIDTLFEVYSSMAAGGYIEEFLEFRQYYLEK